MQETDRAAGERVERGTEACAERGVSVVVPSYNHARFVEQTLRSIFRQTLAPRRLVVIDDGSTDDSPQIIERVLKDCPFECEFVARENRGLSATLNEGFARTERDGASFFAYLGSDDVWLPEFLEARVELLRARREAVLAYGNAYSVDAENRIIDCTTDWARYRDGDVREMLLQTLAPLSPTVVYRRSALARHEWNERARLEDYELYLRLSAEGDFAFDSRVLSAWRWHGSNTSGNLKLMLEERLSAQLKVAPALGLEAGRLARFQSLSRFRSAEEFVRQGRKLEAVGLALRSLRGVPSLREAARMLLRLAVPYETLRRRRRRARERAASRYGSLKI
jgi:alpha-1,3-rhamnosyltransferase